MKKVCLVFISVLLIFAMPFSVIAAEKTYTKTYVTAEKSSIFETSASTSKKLVSIKKDYSFTPIGETKSFWKIEFKKKNDKTVYTGYILKKDTGNSETSLKTDTKKDDKSSSSKSAKVETKTVYWVKSGKSYHYSKQCVTLKRSKDILSGTFEESISAKKKDPCNLCAGGK